MVTSRSGLIAADLEESVAAPGAGDGVYDVGCAIVTAVVDGAVTAAVYLNPPSRSS